MPGSEWSPWSLPTFVRTAGCLCELTGEGKSFFIMDISKVFNVSRLHYGYLKPHYESTVYLMHQFLSFALSP